MAAAKRPWGVTLLAVLSFISVGTYLVLTVLCNSRARNLAQPARGRFSAGLRSGRASRNGTGFGDIFRRHGNPGRIVWLWIVDTQKLGPPRHNCNCRLFIDRYHCWPCPGGKRYQYINTIGGFFENWFERTGAVVPVDTRRPRRVSETHCHGNPITGMAPNH